MIEQVEEYLRQIEASDSQVEKEKIATELQAFYRTLSAEHYENIKQNLLIPKLKTLKARMAELDAAIENLFIQSVEK